MVLHNSIAKKFLLLIVLLNNCILYSMKEKDNTKKNSFVIKFVSFFKKKQKTISRQNYSNSEESSIGGNINTISFSKTNGSFIISDTNDITHLVLTESKNNSSSIENNNDIDKQDVLGQTKLHKAIINFNKKFDEIDDLLNKNASFIITDKKGYNPIQLAVVEEKEEIVKYLINKSMHLEKKDELRFIMVMQAVSFFACNPSMLDLIIEKGVSLEIRDAIGRTPLMKVIVDGRSDKGLLWLILRGANIEAVDNDVRTPLIHAAREGHQWALDILLSYGAHIFSLDSRGKRALDYAEQNKHQEIFKYIKDIQHFMNFNGYDKKECDLTYRKICFWEYGLKRRLGNWKGYTDLKLCYQ